MAEPSIDVGCTPRCWEPRRCDACGREFSPFGRSVALEAASGYCDPIEPCRPGDQTGRSRHLWDEHDDGRHFVDPEGWAAHVAACERCGGEGA